MPAVVPSLDCTQAVNAIVTAHPATLAVFNAWGIDSCCGGQVSVEEAVRRDALDGRALCAALLEAVERG